METSLFELKKREGEAAHQTKKKGKAKLPSRSQHYKQDKARGWRRRADRHSHHRRRNNLRSLEAKNNLGRHTLAPVASSKGSGGGMWQRESWDRATSNTNVFAK